MKLRSLSSACTPRTLFLDGIPSAIANAFVLMFVTASISFAASSWKADTPTGTWFNANNWDGGTPQFGFNTQIFFTSDQGGSTVTSDIGGNNLGFGNLTIGSSTGSFQIINGTLATSTGSSDSSFITHLANASAGDTLTNNFSVNNNDLIINGLSANALSINGTIFGSQNLTMTGNLILNTNTNTNTGYYDYNISVNHTEISDANIIHNHNVGSIGINVAYGNTLKFTNGTYEGNITAGNGLQVQGNATFENVSKIINNINGGVWIYKSVGGNLTINNTETFTNNIINGTGIYITAGNVVFGNITTFTNNIVKGNGIDAVFSNANVFINNVTTLINDIHGGDSYGVNGFHAQNGRFTINVTNLVNNVYDTAPAFSSAFRMGEASGDAITTINAETVNNNIQGAGSVFYVTSSSLLNIDANTINNIGGGTSGGTIVYLDRESEAILNIGNLFNNISNGTAFSLRGNSSLTINADTIVNDISGGYGISATSGNVAINNVTSFTNNVTKGTGIGVSTGSTATISNSTLRNTGNTTNANAIFNSGIFTLKDGTKMTTENATFRNDLTGAFNIAADSTFTLGDRALIINHGTFTSDSAIQFTGNNQIVAGTGTYNADLSAMGSTTHLSPGNYVNNTSFGVKSEIGALSISGTPNLSAFIYDWQLDRANPTTSYDQITFTGSLSLGGNYTLNLLTLGTTGSMENNNNAAWTIITTDGITGNDIGSWNILNQSAFLGALGLSGGLEVARSGNNLVLQFTSGGYPFIWISGLSSTWNNDNHASIWENTPDRAPGAGDLVQFIRTQSTPATVTVDDEGVTIGSILIGAGNASATGSHKIIGGDITFDNNGNTSELTHTDTASAGDTIESNLILNANDLAIYALSSNPLILNGAISGTQNLTISGPGNLTLNTNALTGWEDNNIAVKNLNITDANIIHNNNNGGRGIYVDDGATFTITNSAFTLNNTSGTGIQIGDWGITDATLTLNNSAFILNVASADAPGIGNYGTITLNGNTTFTSNNTEWYSVIENYGTLTLNDTATLTLNNKADGYGIYNDAGNGGALTLNHNSTLTLSNEADGYGIYNDYGVTITLNHNATLTLNNTGGTYAINNYGEITINHNATLNSTSSGGVGIQNYGEITLNHNATLNSKGTENGYGIYNDGDITLNHYATLNSTNSGANEGIINAAGGITTLTLNDHATLNSINTGAGIGIFNFDGAASTTLNDHSTLNSTNSGAGIGIYSSGEITLNHNATLNSDNTGARNGIANDNVITVNDYATLNSINSGSGNGILNSYSNITLNDHATLNSTNNGSGYGIYNAGTITGTGATLISIANTDSGTGLYVAGGATLDVTGTTTFDNIASDGYGIYAYRGSFSIINNTDTFNNNISGYGRGIYAVGGITIKNTTTFNNDISGGTGIYSDAGEITIADTTTFNNNVSAFNTYGLYANNNGNITIKNVGTFTNNVTNGYGIYTHASGGNITIDNSSIQNIGGTNATAIYSSGNFTLQNRTAIVSDNASISNSGTFSIKDTSTLTLGNNAVLNNTGTLNSATAIEFTGENQILAGSGTYNANLDKMRASTRLSPGSYNNANGLANIGTMNVQGEQSWAAFTYDWQVNINNPANYDTITTDSALTLGGTYTLNLIPFKPLIQLFALTLIDDIYDWTLISAASITDNDVGSWTLQNETAFRTAFDLTGGKLSVIYGDNNVLLRYSLIIADYYWAANTPSNTYNGSSTTWEDNLMPSAYIAGSTVHFVRDQNVAGLNKVTVDLFNTQQTIGNLSIGSENGTLTNYTLTNGTFIFDGAGNSSAITHHANATAGDTISTAIQLANDLVIDVQSATANPLTLSDAARFSVSGTGTRDITKTGSGSLRIQFVNDPARSSIGNLTIADGSLLFYGGNGYNNLAGNTIKVNGTSSIFAQNNVWISNSGNITLQNGATHTLANYARLINAGTYNATDSTITIDGSSGGPNTNITNSGNMSLGNSTLTLIGSNLYNSRNLTLTDASHINNNGGIIYNNAGATFSLTDASLTNTNRGKLENAAGATLTATNSTLNVTGTTNDLLTYIKNVGTISLNNSTLNVTGTSANRGNLTNSGSINAYNGANITISNSVLTNTDGSISLTGSNLTISNSTVSNTAGADNALTISGNSRVKIEDVTLFDNTASISSGAGISSISSTVTIDNLGTFNNNVSNSATGILVTSSELTMNKLTTFNNNVSDAAVGLIVSTAATATIGNVTTFNNNATTTNPAIQVIGTLNLNDIDTFTNNVTGLAGGILVTGGTLNIKNTTLTNTNTGVGINNSGGTVNFGDDAKLLHNAGTINSTNALNVTGNNVTIAGAGTINAAISGTRANTTFSPGVNGTNVGTLTINGAQDWSTFTYDWQLGIANDTADLIAIGTSLNLSGTTAASYTLNLATLGTLGSSATETAWQIISGTITGFNADYWDLNNQSEFLSALNRSSGNLAIQQFTGADAGLWLVLLGDYIWRENTSGLWSESAKWEADPTFSAVGKTVYFTRNQSAGNGIITVDNQTVTIGNLTIGSDTGNHTITGNLIMMDAGGNGATSTLTHLANAQAGDTIASNITFNSDLIIETLSANNHLTLSGELIAQSAYSGNGRNLTKTGSGSLLTTNTINLGTGTFTLEQGHHRIHTGTLTASLVTVKSGASIGANGTIAANILFEDGAIIKNEKRLGAKYNDRFTITGTTTFNANASFINLANFSSIVSTDAISGSSRVITNEMNYISASVFNLNAAATYTLDLYNEGTYDITDWTKVQDNNGIYYALVLTGSLDNINGFDGTTWNINLMDASGNAWTGDGIWEVIKGTQGGMHGIWLHYTNPTRIPEPSTYALITAALILSSVIITRRRKK